MIVPYGTARPAKFMTSTIIICTKDRADDLQRALESLQTQTRPPEEVIVVDSGSDDAEARVRAYEDAAVGTTVRYIHSDPGLTKQRNIGIRQAAGDIVHFLDDDVILDERYNDAIHAAYEAEGNEDVIAVGPMLELPRPVGAWACRYRKFFMLPHVNGDGRMLPSGFGCYTWYSGVKDHHPLEVGCGCCTFRRDVFETILYDEWFEGYGYLEDLEFTYRVGKAGRMMGASGARMLHVETPAARTRMRALIAMQIINHYYVFQKHLPKTAYHWACFWWSEFGESILRVMRMIKSFQPGIAIGMIEGYGHIVTGAAKRRMRDVPD